MDQLEISAQSTQTIIDLSEAKEFLRLPTTTEDENSVILMLISAAIDIAERVTWRSIVHRTYKLYLDEFKTVIDIPKPQFVSLESFKCIVSGATELSAVSSGVYELQRFGETAQIWLKRGSTWPSIEPLKGAVCVEFKAGYEDASTIPATLKVAILMILAELYENRQLSSNVQGYQLTNLINLVISPYRVNKFV